MKYEISNEIKNNILVFLERTELQGKEVPAYIQIMNALSNPIQEEMIDTKENV